MANTGSPSNRAVAGRRWGRLTRGDILTVALAAMLCSASYCLSIWHNSRGAADRIVLGPSTVVVGATLCGPDDELDFEAHHTAEKAELSVSTAATTSARRALRGGAPMGTGYRGPFPWSASRGVVWAGNSAQGAEAADGKGWATSSGSRTPEPSARAPTPSSGSSRFPCAPLSTSEPWVQETGKTAHKLRDFKFFGRCMPVAMGLCMGYLDNLKPNMLMDMHLHEHGRNAVQGHSPQSYHTVYTPIVPLISVDLNTMAAAFEVSVSMLTKYRLE